MKNSGIVLLVSLMKGMHFLEPISTFMYFTQSSEPYCAKVLLQFVPFVRCKF